MEASTKQKNELIQTLREENLNLNQVNADLSLSEVQHKELLITIKDQMEKKTKDYESMAGELG